MMATRLGDDTARKAVPSRSDLVDELSQLRLDIHAMVRTDDKVVWEMDDRLLSHRKRTSGYPIASWTRRFGGVWELGLSLTWYLLPRRVRPEINGLFRWLGINQITGSVALSSAFRAITKLAKRGKGVVLINDYWRYIVDWQNLGGIHGEGLSDEQLKAWESEVRHSLEPIERSDEWGVAFTHGVDQVMSAWPWKIAWESIFDPIEFLQRPSLWATPGSTVNPDRGYIEIVESGKRKKLPPSKWNIAVHSSDSALEDMFFRPGADQYVAKPFPKIESVFRPVPRVVTNASESLYLNMSCLYQVIEQAYHGCDLGYSWCSDQLRMVQGFARSRLLNAMDQSGFDHHVAKKEIKIMLDAMELKMDGIWPPDRDRWYKGCFSRVWDLISNCEVLIGKDLVLWLNGILSGWKFTSMFDTTANVAQAYAVSELYSLPKPDCLGMGDDYLERVDSVGTSVCRLEGMVANLFEVKPGDSMIGGVGEFVRYVIGDDRAFGYPVRAVASYIWKSEVSSRDKVGLANLTEVLTQYNTSVGRGLDQSSSFSIAKEGLRRIWGGANPGEAMLWAASPASCGGGGMWEWADIFDYRVWDRVDDATVLEDTRVYPSSDFKRRLFSRGLSGAQVDEYVRSVITMRGVKTRVQKGTLKLSRRAEPVRTPSGVAGKSAFPTAPGWLFEYSTLPGWDLEVGNHIEDRDWNWFDDKFSSESSGLCFRLLLQKSNLRVVTLWLKGKLPYSAPRFSTFNPLVVSDCHQHRVAWSWDHVLCATHIRYSSLLLSAVAAERSTYQTLLENRDAFFDWTP